VTFLFESSNSELYEIENNMANSHILVFTECDIILVLPISENSAVSEHSNSALGN
jgi:hypothetical protein